MKIAAGQHYWNIFTFLLPEEFVIIKTSNQMPKDGYGYIQQEFYNMKSESQWLRNTTLD